MARSRNSLKLSGLRIRFVSKESHFGHFGRNAIHPHYSRRFSRHFKLSGYTEARAHFKRKHMYNPEAFREEDRHEIAVMIHSCRLATFVTNSANGLTATHLPMLFAEDEGEHGVLYGHIAKANPQWKESSTEDALVIFQGPNAYVTPAWYPSKAETGRVVPTWNYVAVHAYGPAEFYHDRDRLLDVVTRLTDLHEAGRPNRWSVSDAPVEYVEGQLRGIVGIRIPIRRIDAKKKLSQNQPVENRAGARAGLAASSLDGDRQVAKIMPE